MRPKKWEKCTELASASKLRLWCSAMENHWVAAARCSYVHLSYVSVYTQHCEWITDRINFTYIFCIMFAFTPSCMYFSSFILRQAAYKRTCTHTYCTVCLCARTHTLAVCECNKFAKERHATKNANTKGKKSRRRRTTTTTTPTTTIKIMIIIRRKMENDRKKVCVCCMAKKRCIGHRPTM